MRTMSIKSSLLQTVQEAEHHQGKRAARNYTIRSLIGITVAVLSLSIPRPAASSAPQNLLLVISKADRKLAVVDLATLRVVVRLDVDADPHEVVATPDGRIAYVSNMGRGDGHGISVLDLVEEACVAINRHGPIDRPSWSRQHRDSRSATVFPAQGAKAVAQYDPKLGRVDWIMGTGQDWTHMIEVTPDGQRFYTTNAGSGTVSIFDRSEVRPPVDASGHVPADSRRRWSGCRP